jgi:annexin A7/11
MKSGLLYLVKAYENDGQGIARDVEYLEDAMSGMGTKDERLYVQMYHSFGCD